MCYVLKLVKGGVEDKHLGGKDLAVIMNILLRTQIERYWIASIW